MRFLSLNGRSACLPPFFFTHNCTHSAKSQLILSTNRHFERRRFNTLNILLLSSMPPLQQIVLIGDSLTQRGYSSGWVSAVSDAFIRRAAVFNGGLSGYNTRWLLANLQGDSPYVAPIPADSKSTPLFVTLWLGANDAALPGNYQHVPLDEYEANLATIVTWIRANLRPRHGVVLITPPPCNGAAWAAKAAEIYGTAPAAISRDVAVTRKYRDAALRVAAERQCEGVVDLFKVFGAADEGSDSTDAWDDCFHDGLHFTPKGDVLACSAILNAVKEQLGVDIEAVPFAVAPHTDFNTQK